MQFYKLEFYTSHHQFYVVDKDSPFTTDSPDFWSDEAFIDRMAIEKGVIGIGTECYGPVKGELKVLELENTTFSPHDYDHIVDGSIEIKSGILQVWTCTANEPEFEVNLSAGFYRVRAYSSNLDTVEFEEGDDFYTIEVWPQEYSARKVIKN